MVKSHAAKRGGDITPPQGGVLIFCFQRRENRAVAETLHLIDDLFQDKEEDPHGSQLLAMDALEQELRAQRKHGACHSWYEEKCLDVPCVSFLAPKTRQENMMDRARPLQLCYSIWDLMLTGNANGTAAHALRSVQRIIPLEMTCYARIEEIRAMLDHILFVAHSQIFKKGLPDQPILPQHQTSYMVDVQMRYHTSITKAQITSTVTELLQSCHCIISAQPSMLYVDLKAPKITISVEIIRNICGASVLVDYVTKYKRGNVKLQYDAQLTGQ